MVTRTFSLWVALALLGAPAGAQPEQGNLSSDDRPWARGVSVEDQRAAQELFREGNGLLKDAIFVRAVERYREALALWDHPAIHYNLALALINLDQPVEVHASLERAMRYGPAPLDQEKFDHARSYLALVRAQLAEVEISCDVEGARVTMDGQLLFVGPGRYEALVRAGSRTIIATKEGYVTTNETRVFPPGETTNLRLLLYTVEDLTRYRRHWSAWKPWAVAGGGATVAAVGGILHWRARDNFRAFDEAVIACGGCVPAPAMSDQKSRAGLQQTFAMTAYGLGGAALTAGLVLAYINRERPYQADAASLSGGVTLTPVVAPGGAGVSASLRF